MTSHPPSSAQPARVGFIGFGEVAGVFSAALAHGDNEVLAYDVLADQPGGLERLAQRCANSRVRFVSLPELIARSDWVLSTVPTTAAESVARRAAPELTAAKTYVDLNATAPAGKQAIASIIAPTGAHFVEGAILTAVGVTGARTRILIGDPRGPGTAEQLSSLGLHATFYHREIGRASEFKLLRSIFSKGMEALLIEFLVAGRRAGLQEDLWREVVDLFAQNGFERVAENWIRTHATACERRYHEVVQVAQEMRALGLDPMLTDATEVFFKRSVAAGLREKLADKVVTVDAVIAALEGATDPEA